MALRRYSVWVEERDLAVLEAIKAAHGLTVGAQIRDAIEDAVLFYRKCGRPRADPQTPRGRGPHSSSGGS